MNENDDDLGDIDVEYIESEIEDRQESAENPTGPGLIPVLGLSALAALIGAIGGAYGAQFLIETPDISPLEARMDREVAAVKDATRQDIDGLKASVQTLRQQTIENMDSPEMDERISRFETRLSEIENRPAPTLPEVMPETLEALQRAQDDGFAWPDNAELKLELADLKAELALLKSDMDALKLQPFAVSWDDLSAVNTAGLLSVESIEFPVSDLLAAAKSDVKKEGFLAQALSKHIKVNEANDPVVLIKEIEAAIKAGDLRAAIRTFDTLPEDLQKIGEAWRLSVQDTR